jgi:S-adenosyl methyltransferase
VLDFTQPVALIMQAALHLIQDEDEPAQIIATMLDALPSGSYFAASRITMEHAGDAIAAGQQTMRQGGIGAQARDSADFASLAFGGLELVPPGVVLVSEWRPGNQAPRPAPAEVNCYGGVARKP